MCITQFNKITIISCWIGSTVIKQEAIPNKTQFHPSFTEKAFSKDGIIGKVWKETVHFAFGNGKMKTPNVAAPPSCGDGGGPPRGRPEWGGGHRGRCSRGGRADEVQAGDRALLLTDPASDRSSRCFTHTPPLEPEQICAAMRGRGGCTAAPSEMADGNQACVKGLVERTVI